MTTRERERDKKIEELRKRIAKLEKKVNRTPQEEQELQTKKKELAELEKEKQQSQNPNQKSYWPWIIGGGVILVLVGVIIYLLMRDKKQPEKYDEKV